MYCGNNKTALQSQKQTADAMMELLNEKSFSQITISELCREAGISRQTFYSLFTNRENVMMFALQEQYCEGLEITVPGQKSCDDSPLLCLCHGCSTYMLRNRSLIKTLVENHIDYLLYDSFYDAICRCDDFLQEVDPRTRSYAASFYAGGFAWVARRYAEEGCTSSADQLEQLLNSLLSGKLF